MNEKIIGIGGIAGLVLGMLITIFILLVPESELFKSVAIFHPLDLQVRSGSSYGILITFFPAYGLLYGLITGLTLALLLKIPKKPRK